MPEALKFLEPIISGSDFTLTRPTVFTDKLNFIALIPVDNVHERRKRKGKTERKGRGLEENEGDG